MITTRMQGFWKVHKRINNLKGVVGKAANDALEKQAQKQYRNIVANASRKDHTLNDLQRLGHPYAKENRSGIQGSMLGAEFAQKPFMIHARKGAVVRSIRYQIKDSSTGPKAVFHYRYTAPYVKYVVKGTEVMFGRNVILDTLNMNEKNIRDQYRKDFIYAINRRTKKLTSIG